MNELLLLSCDGETARIDMSCRDSRVESTQNPCLLADTIKQLVAQRDIRRIVISRKSALATTETREV